MRRHLASWLWVFLLVQPSLAREPVRIAELSTSWGPTVMLVGLRDGLVALGYRENQDFFIAARFTQGEVEALGPAAKELVEYGVDIIVAAGESAARAASAATTEVPIVCFCDAIEIGLAQSLAHPGGNLTGISDLDVELGAKRLQIFKELVPGLRRILYPYHPDDPEAASVALRYRSAARELGIELVERPVRTQEEVRAMVEMPSGEVDGILAPDLTVLDLQGTVHRFASRQGIPAMFPGGKFWVERGGLISYGPDYEQSGRLAARLVDKVLRGANPAEIPIEQNPSVRLFLNVKTAATLGLGIPRSLLVRADEVFE